jgi:hypothetical protein
MAKTMEIKIKYVQIADRIFGGFTLIGQPVKYAFGKKIRKELFDDNPDIILMPSVSPEEMKRKLKRVKRKLKRVM